MENLEEILLVGNPIFENTGTDQCKIKSEFRIEVCGSPHRLLCVCGTWRSPHLPFILSFALAGTLSALLGHLALMVNTKPTLILGRCLTVDSGSQAVAESQED